ncbi:amidase [Microbaculum marinum]|uniref:Amidase n=1 Tax=Microbaculum marinum TaxID=1764581 RepID=A0AAW9RK69_9HYPH
MAGIAPEPVSALAQRLRQGSTTSEALAEAAIAAIEDPSGEGSRVFIEVDADRIRAQARASDLLRAHGALPPSPLAGLPVSIKDLFDVAGEVTKAGSVVLADQPPARFDAPAIARLRAAGAVLAGRTNMTEFAYSGVGLNPHYGTPANPWDRAAGRIPGGSSSGAAVSVTDAMAAVAIGTDTGGSCRIPAALCGLVGLKPTASRIPLEGCYPLAPSLDSIGALGRSVDCVATTAAVMAGERPQPVVPVEPAQLRIAVPRTYVLDGMDAEVGRSFETALSRLSEAGATLVEVVLDDLGKLPELSAGGGIVGAEAAPIHADTVARAGDRYDPRVLARIEFAQKLTSADHRRLLRRRAELIDAIAGECFGFDALAMPTVPIVAPLFSEFDDDERFGELNRLLLRNPTVFNLLDGCAISLPCHEPGAAPVGLMLGSFGGRDAELMRVAATAAPIVGPSFG